MPEQKKIIEAFNRLIVDFAQDDEAMKSWNMNDEIQLEIPNNFNHYPYIIFIIFIYLEGYKYLPRSEKIAWEIPIKYKNYPLLLSHRKFGFRVHGNSKNIIPKELVPELFNNLIKVIPIAESLIETTINERVNEGEITLANQYHTLKARYLYFRKRTKRNYNRANKIRSQKPNFATRDWNRAYEADEKANYNFVAMMDAYFSQLEHILVLMKPFIIEPNRECNLSEYISMNWSDKLKALINLSENQDINLIYNKLNQIKENYRNRMSHGNFAKNGCSFFVHMKGTGAIPFLLTRSNESYHYGFNLLPEPTFKDVTETFDEFDHLLQKGITKYGMMFIDSGLAVSYDDIMKEKIVRAIKSEESFKNFVLGWGRMSDNAANMDW